MKVGLKTSPEAQCSYQKGREACCVSTVHSSLCTLKFLFQSLLWELRFKSLTNVFVSGTVGTAVVQFLYSSSELDSVSPQVRGTENSGCWPQPLNSIDPSAATDELSFVIRGVCSFVSFPDKPIFHFRRPCCWTRCVFPSFSCCSSSDAVVLLQIWKEARILAFGMGLPDSFYTVVLYGEKKEKKQVLYTNLV